MSHGDHERILDRVRKLLAQAEDQAGTPEGDAFSAQAERLMIKYGIEQAVLDAAEGAGKGEIVGRWIKCRAPYAKQKSGLLCGIAKWNQGKGIVYEPDSWSRGGSVVVYGFERDVDAIEWLFTSLSMQAVSALATRDIPYDPIRRKAMDPATFKAGWLMDFRVGVESRMREMQRSAVAEADQGSGAELVLRNKHQQVQDHVDELHGPLGNMRYSSSGRGAGDGFSAGRNADLGQTRVGGHRQQLAQ